MTNDALTYILNGVILAGLVGLASGLVALATVFFRKHSLMKIELLSIIYAIVEVLANGKRKEFQEQFEKKKAELKDDNKYTRGK